jgi:uncharacterized protein with GYD domain
MGTYVLLSQLTPLGRQTLHANPSRVDAVNEEVERFGCTVLTQYALLGAYDFLTIVQAPDAETVAHLSIDLGSRGTLTITTFPAISIDALESKLKDPAHQLAARPVEGQGAGDPTVANQDQRY